MIHCLLIQITRNHRGQAIRNERPVLCEEIQIGRASECKIHLPDHRVNLHHAVIKHADDGRFYIECEGPALDINGAFEQYAELTPGTRILIGPYELIVEAAPSNEILVLSYELIHPLADVNLASAAKASTTLAGTGLSKRKPALWLAALVTFVFLILPITYALSPNLHKVMERLPVAPDEPWNVGQMSPGHRALSTKCNTCHQQPFKAVPDKACQNCHQSVANHINDKVLHERVFKNVRCAECHLDHRGQIGLIRHDTAQCVACHGNIKARNAQTKIPNIHDFSLDHPAFHLMIRTGPGEHDTKRVLQTDKANLIEKSGLKYSHEVHFDKALIELPHSTQARDIQCDDCHKMDDAGVGFEPMIMTMTCQQSKCHALDFSPRVEGRQVPHAAEKTVMTTLREFYASRAISKTYVDGVTIDDLRRARNWAYTQADNNAKILFSQTGEGTCLECHEVSYDGKNKEVPWQVAPVHVADHWLPKSRFPHIKHQTTKCTECHDVMHSDKSSDVAIPAIDKCKVCHVGSKQVITRVSSTCDTCHIFHGFGTQQAHLVEMK